MKHARAISSCLDVALWSPVDFNRDRCSRSTEERKLTLDLSKGFCEVLRNAPDAANASVASAPRQACAPLLSADRIADDPLLYERLEQVRLDRTYLEEAASSLMATLESRCKACEHSERCGKEIWDGPENVAGYCPNTEDIDRLVLERDTGREIE